MFSPILKKFTDDHRLVVVIDFALKVLLAYGLWKLFHYWASIPGTSLHEEYIQFNNWLAAHTIMPAAFILRKLGYTLTYNQRNLFIEGTPGMYVANHCLGIPPAVIFTVFILAYQGNWVNKLWYIPLGIFCIYAINVFRVVALGITEVCCFDLFFELAHTWVYLLLSYGMFFLLITTWMNRFSKK